MLVSGTTGWDKSMSTRHALLNALVHGDASGYDLVKRFQPSAAHWWHPRPAQMYTELSRMEADGLVSGETVIQTKYPNKRVFSLTDAGRAELQRYAEVPSPPAEFKDELVIKMMGLDVADPAALLADLARRRKWCVERLRKDQSSVDAMLGERTADQYAAEADDLGEYLWRLRSIGLMQASVEWCDAVIGVIEARRSPANEQRTA